MMISCLNCGDTYYDTLADDKDRNIMLSECPKCGNLNDITGEHGD